VRRQLVLLSYEKGCLDVLQRNEGELEGAPARGGFAGVMALIAPPPPREGIHHPFNFHDAVCHVCHVKERAAVIYMFR